MKRCEFPECRRPHYAHGICHSHYTQMAGRGWLGPINARKERRPDAWDAPCHCGEQTQARNYTESGRVLYRICPNGHRTRWSRDRKYLGVPMTDAEKRIYGETCDFAGCGRPRKRKSSRCSDGAGSRLRFCQGHEKQKDRHGFEGMAPLMTREEIGRRNAELRKGKPRATKVGRLVTPTGLVSVSGR